METEALLAVQNSDIARESSDKIYQMFLDYLERDDFLGADRVRKFLQMGYTRSRRYANHKSGRKYKHNPEKERSKEAQIKARQDILPNEVDPVKAESAAIFKEKWMQTKTNEKSLQLLKKHKQMYEQK